VRAAALLAAGVAAVAAVPAATAGGAAKKAPKPRVVKVADDYFAPAKITNVSRGRTVAWRWLAVNGNTHDVKLRKGPKGFKRFHSAAATADFTFKRKLTKKGRYVVICTFHEDMKMTITVK
jgi:plastocyanin